MQSYVLDMIEHTLILMIHIILQRYDFFTQENAVDDKNIKNRYFFFKKENKIVKIS